MIFTFDPYYSPNVSNQFMEDFKNNGGKYRTYIQAQPPYYWYYEVKDTDIPKFLKFKPLYLSLLISFSMTFISSS